MTALLLAGEIYKSRRLQDAIDIYKKIVKIDLIMIMLFYLGGSIINNEVDNAVEILENLLKRSRRLSGLDLLGAIWTGKIMEKRQIT
jgi:hypothetical protein